MSTIFEVETPLVSGASGPERLPLRAAVPLMRSDSSREECWCENLAFSIPLAVCLRASEGVSLGGVDADSIAPDCEHSV